MPLLTVGICPQLTASIISECKAVGIQTVTDFILLNPEDIAKKTKIPYKDISCIRHILLANYSGFLQQADSLYSMLLETLAIIDTGSKRVNKFLNGGIYAGEITEIYGSPSSGKTQFCLAVASNLISETGNTVLYIDTNGSFNAHRVKQILIQKSGDAQSMKEKLQNIKVTNIYDVYGLFDILDHLKTELCEKKNPFFKYLKLLIIDSITHLLAPCFGGKYVDGCGLMSNVAQQLKMLCCEHMLSILVCNNTVQSTGFEARAALGSNWKYIPSVSLCIKKLNNSGLHKLNVVKSCRSGLSKDITFSISDCGIGE